ncbi:MAG: hypothetical protein NC238_10350 [Dehalobacter sp.]|nr:hypothetical protein [Dehalobacter sp.]
MRNLFVDRIKNTFNFVDHKNKEMVTGSEEVLGRIYVSLQAHLEGVNPYPIETIINSIVSEIENLQYFKTLSE